MVLDVEEPLPTLAIKHRFDREYLIRVRAVQVEPRSECVIQGFFAEDEQGPEPGRASAIRDVPPTEPTAANAAMTVPFPSPA